jgi:perosamine synthetase
MITEKSNPEASPHLDFIPLAVPAIQGNEWRYIKECLDTNWVSSVGPFVDRFESELAARIGTRFAVATVNGTAALHVALLLAGVKPEDEVLVSTLTFIAPVNAIRYVGAWPVFIDAEPDYWQMDPSGVVDFLERGCRWHKGALQNRVTGRRVSAVIPVHILGHPVDLDPIIEIARKYGLMVIEDATEGLGATYRGRPLGSIGDIGCFSFNGNKIISTGGGGMLVTSNEDWARRAKYLTTQAKDDPTEYVHSEIGYNYRLPNVLAAMGCAQLEQLEVFIAAKQRIASRYAAGLQDLPGISLMKEASWASSSWWLYTVLVDNSAFGSDSRQLMRSLNSKKIQTRPLWQPIHLSAAHRGRSEAKMPTAEKLYQQALSLPCSAGLGEKEQTRVIEEVRTVAARATPEEAPLCK